LVANQVCTQTGRSPDRADRDCHAFASSQQRLNFDTTEAKPLKSNTWIVIGAVSAAVAVGLGAIGAHGLEGWLERTFEPVAASARLENWQTAAQYQRFHALGMVVVGLLLQRSTSKWIHAAGWLMLLGTALFSGLLYVYAVSPAKWMGPIFPIGGFSFIAAWLLLGIGAFTQAKPSSQEE
jgi:uncharacterized membrane protein YgdD (TMEM256/DUF423 family)